MSVTAADMIERIGRGRYQLTIVTHGEHLEHREVQLWDRVERQMVKGFSERALIATLLLDPRTAAKHFEAVLAREEAEKTGNAKEEGLERVLKANPHLTTPRKRTLGFTLRPSVPVAERLAQEAKDAAAHSEPEKRPIPTERVIRINGEPAAEDFASCLAFDTEEAQSLFISLCASYGTDRVAAFMGSNDPGGSLDMPWVGAMGEELARQELEEFGPLEKRVAEAPADAPKPFQPEGS